jgi:hypothetical protein
MPPKAAAPWSRHPASSQSSFPQFVERRDVSIDFMIFSGCAAVNPSATNSFGDLPAEAWVRSQS